jgi:uncharacterized protein YecE (DUF72 family)
MWAHPSWVGRYLASGKGRELADYATWCNAVEGNTTFYAAPSPATIARWAEQAPADFRFAFKVPRTITHEQRLQPSAHRDLAAFLRLIEPLGERVGPVQLQLPPSFGPSQVGTLIEFVRRLPRSQRWIVELRHQGFFDGGAAHRQLDEALAALDIGRVVLDTRALYSVPADSDAAIEERRTKPALPIVTDVMGEAPLVRMIGADDVGATSAGASVWVPNVQRWLAEGRTPYVFIHQPENRRSPELARSFHAQVAAAVSGLAPLPTPIEHRAPPPALFDPDPTS